jgi:hypothetical protein
MPAMMTSRSRTMKSEEKKTVDADFDKDELGGDYNVEQVLQWPAG